MNGRIQASIAVLALSLGCVEVADSPKTASGTALRVFELAQQPDPDPQALDDLFDGEDDGDSDRHAALGDVLERLAEASGVRVTAAEPLAGLEITAVDLEGDLPGGGLAAYTFQLQARADGSWRAIWLAGPGVEWPPRRRPRGLGLSTSTPPPGASGKLR